MKAKLILLLVCVASCASAQTSTALSPRRLWAQNPDAVTLAVLTRVEQHLARAAATTDQALRDAETAKADEGMEFIRLVDSSTLLTDEFNPDTRRVLRFTPQYLIDQLRSVAGSIESLVTQFGITMTKDQAVGMLTTAKAYRDAAALVEWNCTAPGATVAASGVRREPDR